MSDTFDYPRLWNELFRMACNNSGDVVVEHLRTRIEAAFVPVETYHRDTANRDTVAIEATARAEAAEARNKVLEEANKRAKNAADAILAHLCAEVGRWLIEGKDEPDMIKVAHDYGVVIPVRAFADLYDATDTAALGGEHE